MTDDEIKLRGYAAIGLDNPKCAANAGGVMRAAGCYGAAMVVLSGLRMKRWSTDTSKAWRTMPVVQCEHLHEALPYDCVPVAVDLLTGAKPLHTYVHPERAFYVFGAEDATLGSRITNWCRDKVYVPTHGCMNLAATVNVVLYDRLAKQLRGKR